MRAPRESSSRRRSLRPRSPFLRPLRRASAPATVRTALVAGSVAFVWTAWVAGAAGQRPATLRVAGPGGEEREVAVGFHRGYAAVPGSVLALAGWTVETVSGDLTARLGDQATLRLARGNPWLAWDGRLLQLVDPPYLFGDDVFVPLQLLADLLPARLPDAYAFRPVPPVLELRGAGLPGGGAGPSAAADALRSRLPPSDPAASRGGAPSPAAEASPGEPPLRVVVIDPGHGGDDPGALGPSGLQEKEVALGFARALARELRSRPGLEVHVTRDSDVLVPIWQRGEWATGVKGARPGIFVSLHANGLPDRRAVRGFETYFLSDARTEHEQRVAALENAPLAREGTPAPQAGDPGLSFILNELRNLDHQHWSALLAELVQDHLGAVHPGPNRGVKQGPFAVITNALMPAVLVEVGFITNREEERLLAGDDFREGAARALAAAIVEFFGRYPPGAPPLAGTGR